MRVEKIRREPAGNYFLESPKNPIRPIRHYLTRGQTSGVLFMTPMPSIKGRGSY